MTETELEQAKQLERIFLSRKIAAFFELAAQEYDFADFFAKLSSSRLFDLCLYDEATYSQSPRYILALYKEQFKDITKPREMFEDDIAYWIGYLAADWYLKHDKTREFYTPEVFEWLYYGYDTLHTQSLDYVYDLLCERFPDICK